MAGTDLDLLDPDEFFADYDRRARERRERRSHRRRPPRPRGLPGTLTSAPAGRLLIAATAHASSLDLYTRNGNDFTGLEGLVRVVPI